MKKILLLTLMCALTGCVIWSKEMNKIHRGMTESEVVKILGKPMSRGESNDGSIRLYFGLVEGAFQTPTAYCVNFINGKVDSFGRDGAGSSMQSPMIVPAPIIAK